MLLFTTSLRVKDLRLPGFYKIDTLDTAEGVGYQRLLNETRAKRLADYLLDAHKALEAFLPTSLFLATDKVLPFDEANSTLTIDTEQVGQFNVVDGQHRIRGLVLAAEKETDMNEFQVPVNIAVGLDEISQMCHFLIVNPNRKIFEARKRETAALGAGEKLVLGHPLAATIGDSARCMQNLEKVLFTGPKTSDTVTFICD